MKSILVYCAAALLAAAPVVADVSPPEDALREYVTAPDASYAWTVITRHDVPGAEIVELRLHSQTWRNTLWKHRLHVIKPDSIEAAPLQGLLVVAGGRWREEYDTNSALDLPAEAALFIAIARRLETIVAVIEQVPFQPIFGLREDELIAYTFEQYLASGESDWPLLLPMVKSAVRAMDATQAFAAEEWGLDVDRFTVTGGSKRGWTTWLTGAADDRAATLVPIVIDVLNFEAHLPHQQEIWGETSAQIAPYTRRGLHDVLSSEAGSALRKIVDPYSYRERLTQPKLIVIGTNDPYFPLDSLNLYWRDLAEPKHVLYLPNEDHGVDDFARLIPALDAIHRATAAEERLPALQSALERRVGGTLRYCVRADSGPIAVTIWSADSEDTDFRDATFLPTAADSERGSFVYETELPSSGFRAIFAEALFEGPNGRYMLSTNMRLIDSSGEPPFPATALEESTSVCPS